MPNDFDQLIQAAMEEEDVFPERLQQANPLPRLNHPMSVALAWLLLAAIIVFSYTYPIPAKMGSSAPGLDTRLGVSLYLLAHHIETHRAETGALPEYIEDHWTDLDLVTYTKTNDGYVLDARIGGLTLAYAEGEDPESLLMPVQAVP